MRVVATITRKKFLTEMDLLRLKKALLMCRMAANSTYLVDKQPPSEWTTMLDLIQPLLESRRLRYVRLRPSPSFERMMVIAS
jgi:hypothetical protein